MPQAQGYMAQLGLDFETTFGQTPATPNGVLMPIQSSKLRSKQNLIEDKTIRANRNPAQPTPGFIDVSGGIVVPVDEIYIGYWLKALFGDPTTTGTTSGSGSTETTTKPYTHVFQLGATQPQLSMVLEQGYTDIDQYFLYNGCKISKFGISFGGDGELTASIDIMGAKETITSTSFNTPLTTYPLTKFSNFSASIKEGGTSIASVTKFDFNIDTALDGGSYVIGAQGFRGSINESIPSISGTLTALFDSATLLNKAMTCAESSLVLKVKNDKYSLEFKLPEVMYERNSPGIDGPKGVLIELPFRVYWQNATENTAIVATLVNGQSAY